jgi:hypothetical protein
MVLAWMLSAAMAQEPFVLKGGAFNGDLDQEQVLARLRT